MLCVLAVAVRSSAVVYSGPDRVTAVPLVLLQAYFAQRPVGVHVAVVCTSAMLFVQRGYTIVAQSSTLPTRRLPMRRWETEVATNLRQEALYR